MSVLPVMNDRLEITPAGDHAFTVRDRQADDWVGNLHQWRSGRWGFAPFESAVLDDDLRSVIDSHLIRINQDWWRYRAQLRSTVYFWRNSPAYCQGCFHRAFLFACHDQERFRKIDPEVRARAAKLTRIFARSSRPKTRASWLDYYRKCRS